MSGATSELAHLFRALKAPAAARALTTLAEKAREESWSYEKFLEALLATEVSARDSHGGENRIKTARFPARKTLEEFDFTFQRSIKKQVVEHLGQLDFLHGRQNVILLGPPGTGKTHLATALGIRACLAAQRVLFATATAWVASLGEAKHRGQLEAELKRLALIPLLVVDEVGYIPFDPETANLMLHPQPQGRQLPPPRQGPRPPPNTTNRPSLTSRATLKWPTFRPAQPAHFSTDLDNADQRRLVVLPTEVVNAADGWLVADP